MVAIVVPAVEAAAVRVLAALGVGVVAGAAGEAARDAAKKRSEAADQAKSAPIAKTEATTRTKEKCKECPPDKGAPFNRSTAGWSETSITYQARIGGLPVGPGFITEWLFNGVTFDGFDSSQCLLKEAKAKYDQFFDDFRRVRGWWTEGADKLLEEAYRQGAAAQPRPPIQLRWHFMEPISFRYFSKVIKAAYPDIEVVYQP
jgi:hypothetical protein